MKLSDSRSMRNADRRAIEERKIPSTLLMTCAAGFLLDAAMCHLPKDGTVTVFAGPGNNGGDGISLAAMLTKKGFDLRCFLIGAHEKMTADALEMERRLIELGSKLEVFDAESAEQRAFALASNVIIDAIFGIGLNSPITGAALAATELINASHAFVISADIPSGISADTGEILGAAVKADLTVTFSMAKPGHFVEPGSAFCGKLSVSDIGIPQDILCEIDTKIHAVLPHELSFPAREPITHKGSYGKLFILGGSIGFSGAPALCAAAALRGGAGTVSLGVPNDIYEITASRLWESMCFPLPDDGYGRLSASGLPHILERIDAATVAIIGCGLARSNELNELVRGIVQSAQTRLVIDADGLFALGDDAEIIKSAKKPPVLTPHEGEFARLGGKLTGNRLADALDFAKSRGCILVLKGHRVICAFPDGEAHIISAGNPGMAKGGSGDVLAGLIGSLLCQLPVKAAVITACAIHAISGDFCAEKYGEYSMLPTDMIAAVPEIMRNITKAKKSDKMS